MPVSSVQDCIFALGKAHMRSTPSLRSYLGQRDLLLIFRIVSNFNTLKTKGAGRRVFCVSRITNSDTDYLTLTCVCDLSARVNTRETSDIRRTSEGLLSSLHRPPLLRNLRERLKV